MTDSSIIRLDIRQEAPRNYKWVVQSTAPVADLFESSDYFVSRVGAVADFQRVCEILGWTNDITQVPVR